MDNLAIAEELTAMETLALERWGKGDPSGFLEISSEEVTYFDPFLKKMIKGKESLTALYESIRGQIFADSFELIEPSVQTDGSTAVLAYNFISCTGKSESRWNCTEVYSRQSGQWQIIHTHWSFTAPGQ